MSREALGDAAPDAQDDVRAGADDARTAVLTAITLEEPDERADHPREPAPSGEANADPPPDSPSLDENLDLDLADPPATDAGVAAPPGRTPRRSRLVTAAAAAVVLVVGVLAGATSARQQGQAALDAAARVVVAVDLDQSMGYDQLYGTADPGSQTGDVLQFLTISFTGRVGGARSLVVERLETAFGTFDLYPPLTVTDGGRPSRTLVRGPANCARIKPLQDADSVTGHVLETAVAVVRPSGSRRDVRVRVLVPNPAATLFSLDQRCSPANYQQSGDSYSAGALAAHVDGSLDFVLAAGTAFRRGREPAHLAVLGLAATGGGQFAELRPTSSSTTSATFTSPDGLWTMTTTPALPLTSQDSVRVRIRFSYRCPPSVRTDQLLPVAPDLRVGTVMADGTVNPYLDGWDDSVLTNATAAAAVVGCKATPAGTRPPARQGIQR